MSSKVYSDFGILKPISYLSNAMLSNLFYSLGNITFNNFIDNMFSAMKHIPYEYINVGFDISKDSTKYIHQGFFRKTSRGYAVYNFAFSETDTYNDEMNIDMMDNTKYKINTVEKGNYIIVGIKNSKQYLWECNTLILVYKVENIRDDGDFCKHIAQSVLVNISMTHQLNKLNETKPLSEVYFDNYIDRVDIGKDYKIVRIHKVIESMIKKFNEMDIKVSN